MRRAVSTAPVHLAHILGKEVLDCHCTSSIVLQDLVFGITGPAAVDVGRAGCLLKGRRVLAHVGPPDVVEGAGTETVHALAIVGPDDHVGEGRAVG